jgi:Ran GTPase-activating protein (RanGAP) involved in mRNA processing and transport
LALAKRYREEGEDEESLQARKVQKQDPRSQDFFDEDEDEDEDENNNEQLAKNLAEARRNSLQFVKAPRSSVPTTTTSSSARK